MCMSRKLFCLPRNWIYLLQNYFWSYVYLKAIYKTLKRIRKIQIASELTILLNLFSKPNKKIDLIPQHILKLPKLEYCSLCGKVNFSVIHPTHITIYSF